MSRQLFSKCVAEFLGTFALVFAGCGSVMVSENYGLDPFAIPLVFGLVVASMIYAVGHISGAHFNPAVTVAFSAARHFPKVQVLPYVLAQYLAAVFAVGVLIVLLPETQTLGETVPTVEMWRAFVWEFILTFLLMFVIISVATDARAEGVMAGAAIGSVVALCAMFGGPVTGASMNPARTFGPNLFQGELTPLWLYTIAPILGAISAAKLYEWMRCESHRENVESELAKGCC